jgi:hypothetical protein
MFLAHVLSAALFKFMQPKCKRTYVDHYERTALSNPLIVSCLFLYLLQTSLCCRFQHDVYILQATYTTRHNLELLINMWQLNVEQLPMRPASKPPRCLLSINAA